MSVLLFTLLDMMQTKNILFQIKRSSPLEHFILNKIPIHVILLAEYNHKALYILVGFL